MDGWMNGWMDGLGSPRIVRRSLRSRARPAARPKPTFRPIGDCLAAWTLAWEDSTAQVLTVAHGGDRSNDTRQIAPRYRTKPK